MVASKSIMNPQEKQPIDQNKLTEGQEVSLGLPEPNRQNEPYSVEPEIGLQEDIANLDTLSPPQAPEVHRSANPIKVANSPKINLSPRALSPNSHGLPLNEKQRKALSKLQKIRKHKYWYNIRLVIGTVLVFVLIFNSQWFISQFMYLFSRPQLPTTEVQQTEQKPAQPAQPTSPQQTPQSEVVDPQNKIIIPKIGVQAPLVFIDTNDEAGVLKSLRDGVVHYYGTAKPGENGNSVFFGHSSNDWWEAGNYKFIFVLLEKLVPGDTYEIHYNSRKYVYTVTETKIVMPTDLSVLNQTGEPISTLITCTPPGTSWKRFIVHAKQTFPAPTMSQPTQASQPQVATGSLPATTVNGQAQLPSAPPSIWDQIRAFFQDLLGGHSDQANTGQSKQNQQPQHLPEVN